MKRILIISILLLAVIFTVNADRRRLLMTRNVAAAASSPTPELVWWKLNENTGTTAADTSTTGTNTLYLANSAMWIGGKAGSALLGNGSTYHAEATNVLLNVNVITVSFWASNSAFSGNEMLFESTDNAAGNAYAMNAYTDAISLNIGFSGAAASLKACTVPNVSSGWNHYLIVFNGTTGAGVVTVWTNGVSATVTTTLDTRSGTANFANSSWNILARNAGASIISDGAIDDFRIYNRDASGSVSAIYADPK